MTAVFDWSGAPEGERWVWSGSRYVLDEDTPYIYNHSSKDWVWSGVKADWIRENGTRVESSRPVPRVGDRVRVTLEGTVSGVDLDGFDVRDDHDLFRYFMLGQCDVEVLQRADPPLQPGDLVRDDGDGGIVYNYAPDPAEADGWDYVQITGQDIGGRFDRTNLVGPLVKVQLTEVPDA